MESCWSKDRSLGLPPWVLAHPRAAVECPLKGDTQRISGTDRANADALGEAVIGHNVLIQLPDGPLPQAGAVVAFVQVEDYCGGKGISKHGAQRSSWPQPSQAQGHLGLSSLPCSAFLSAVPPMPVTPHTLPAPTHWHAALPC